MSGIVAWSAKNPVLAMLIAALVGGYGLFIGQHLAIDAVPDVTNTQVQVVTRAPALSALEMEAQVTQPVERAMAGTPGLVDVRSVTKLGISIVTLVFRDDIDVYFARAQVSERLTGVRDTIPADTGRPELGPIATALGEIYMFELRAAPDRPRSSEELRTIIEWQIGTRLRQVPGVVEVVGFGGSTKQYQVTLDPQRLAAHEVSVEEVRSALAKDNRVAGGGYIERSGEQVVLRGDARFRGIEDIAATVVRTDDRGVPLRVGQLGKVDTGPALRQGAMTRDGRGEIVGASVLMLKDQNSREVVKRVKDAIEALRPELPAGLTIDPYYDRAEFIDRVLHTVAKNLSEGALIVVLCLLLTLGSLRAGMLVAGAIPFSLLVGFIGLDALGYSGNVMSLGAIDFGIIVEGSVIAVEHAMAHGGAIDDDQIRRSAITHAMMSVMRAAIFGVVITLLTFLPLATLQDVEGKMFRPVVFSLCFMLAGSILYSVTVVPALGPWIIRTKTTAEPIFVRVLRRAYEPALRWSLDRPRLTLAATFGVALLMLASVLSLGAEFLPRIFEGAFAIDATRPPSTALSLAIEMSREAETALKETPEVLSVVSRIGRPEGSVDPAGPESSDVFLILKPRESWRPDLTPEALTQELSDKLAVRLPASINSFSQPIEMRVNDLIAGVKGDVAVKVFGEDLGALADSADRIRRALQGVPGAVDVKMEIPTGLPSILVTANREKAGRVGVPPGVVLDTLAMTRAGLPIGVVRESERTFDLVLKLGVEELRDEADLARLPVATSEGRLVPLGLVSDLATESTVVQISREHMRRRLAVQANVRGRDVVGFVADAQARVATLDLPKSVQVVWGGQFQNFNRAKDRLALLVPVVGLVIALMLFITFGSIPATLVTLLSLPFAVAGGVAALWVRDLPLSIPAGVGFIALSGVAVLAGIVTTSKLQELSPDIPPDERVFRAAAETFRSRLSTSIVPAIGFIPAALATGAGSEVQRPLATVVIGGLLVAVVLTLFALPAMLLSIARLPRPPAPPSDAPTH